MWGFDERKSMQLDIFLPVDHLLVTIVGMKLIQTIRGGHGGK